MDAADAAGGEDADAGHVGDHHGGGDGAGAVLAPGHQHRQVTAAGLGDLRALLAEILDLLGGEAGLQPPADDGDGGRDGAVVPDDLLHLQGGLYVLGIGHSVGDDGGLQGHHGLARRQSGGDLGGDVKILVHGWFLLLKIVILLYFAFAAFGGKEKR